MSDLYDSCTDSRLRASLELDDELSELDAVRLRAHLGVCPECARWAAEAGALTAQLRQAELPEPEFMPLLAPRRVRFQRSAAVAGAMASVAAAALGVLAVTLPAARSPGFQGLGSAPEADAARATVTFQPASPAVRPRPSQPNQNRPAPD